MTRCMPLAFIAVLLSASVCAGGPTADDVRKATGIEAGLAVVIGGEAEPACGLAAGGRLLVHLLAADAKHADALRAKAHERGLGGRVTVDVLAADGHLPYGDRFVNLLVADLDALGERAPDDAEIDRVLAVRGVRYTRRDGAWAHRPAPKDDRIDGWFCRWYDATGNCVGRDRVAGFPAAVQWQHGPAMEDGTGNGKTPLIADGRLLHLDARSGELLCRDAGNGSLLWRRYVGLPQNAGLAVAAGRVHLWHDADAERADEPKKMRESGAMVAIDLASGEIVQTYDEGLRPGTAKPIEWMDGRRKRRDTPVAWFAVNDRTIVQACGADLVVLDRATGRRRWRQAIDGATWFSPAVAEGMVLGAEAVHPARRGRHDGSDHVRAVTAFDLKTGKRLWRCTDLHRVHEVEDKNRTYRARSSFKPLSVAGGRVLVQTASYQFRQGGGVAVLDGRTGKEMWHHRFEPKQRYTHGSYRAVLRGGEVIVMCGLRTTRFDAATGKLLGEAGPPRKLRRGVRANGACTASRATVRWLMANAYLYVGPEGQVRTFFGARGQCGEGVVPAHGLVFVPPAACDCGDYTRGYQALSPRVPGRAIRDGRRLEKGPAYGGRAEQAPRRSEAGQAWSHFLADPQRTSAVAAAPRAELHELWRARLSRPQDDALAADRRLSERWLGELSAPTVAGGVVAVSLPERHALTACDARTGRVRWRVPTRGKVDSPPTLAEGLAVYGSDAGAVTARRLADGAVAWRFRAAPTDGVAMHHGHLASAFGLPGSVLVLGGRVVAVAGHHTDLGGLHCWVLELSTGRPLARRVIRADQPAVVTNAVTVADANGQGFWMGCGIGGSALHLSLDLRDLAGSSASDRRRKGGPTTTGAPPRMMFDRSGTRIRFRTADGRGGSTHSWKQAMRCGAARGHRIARGGEIAYVVQDPTSRGRHRVRAAKTATLRAVSGTWRQAKVHWQCSQADLGNPESISALIKAGELLYLAGGRRDGSKGFVQVRQASTGRLRASHEMPARVTECGLAAAGGRLYVCCEDGRLVCLAPR